ncbi:60S ribosomal protein L18 [Tubulinosema ratisbonensis]|uniref:60S ribosomal protein L18 n=1 Tax=Tubulinosema ratisbonensis TaxID=291195 RepID=A0A437AHR2_9MICR|nr:60S ribosomal protein L18 [Tubulinosema ratisbonensis]
MAQLERKKIVNKGRVKFVSRNIYRQSLINLFTRIAKHSSNLDVQRIVARLRMSNNSRHPVDLKRLASEHEKSEGKILVVVSKVLDDETLFSIPKMKVVCLDISKTAKAKIEKFGGEVYTLDCLFEVSSELKDICLVKGDMTARKCYKYFGACGIKGSKTYPKSGNKGKNREKRIFK